MLVAFALALLCAPTLGHAEDAPGVRATIECARAAEPGRVRCEVEARPVSGGVLRWGDVEIIETPAFVSPLRGRTGPREATSKDPGSWRWALALVAKKAVVGAVRARVRVVQCLPATAPEEERCTPHIVLATTSVAVGP